eukprot:TRINITY_DN11053_c0_g1_i3.p1 TRINITY_DN11053_c0_g1~~TRINITY_DN11053_c0_g1_i3.p1  ORF type:complete len:355 (+),score=29.55 TRINITY_DN11053_c0_g1_i3:285-1349(+)
MLAGSELRPTGLSEEGPWTILTCEGNASGAPCLLPFAYNANVHQMCIRTLDSDNRPWCFTDIKGSWGFCDCPTNSGIPVTEKRAAMQWSRPEQPSRRKFGWGAPPCLLGESMIFPDLNGQTNFKASAATMKDGVYCSGTCFSDSHCRRWAPNSFCSMRQGTRERFCERSCHSHADCGTSLGFQGRCINDRRGHRVCAFIEADVGLDATPSIQSLKGLPRRPGYGSPPCLGGEVEVVSQPGSPKGQGGQPVGDAKGSYCAIPCNSGVDCSESSTHCSVQEGGQEKYCQKTCASDADCPAGALGRQAVCSKTLGGLCTYTAKSAATHDTSVADDGLDNYNDQASALFDLLAHLLRW